MRHTDLPADINCVTADILDSAITVHSAYGPGLMESAYKAALAVELRRRGRRVEQEVGIHVEWRGTPLGLGYRIDLRVDGVVLVEAKAVEALLPVHHAQLWTYLKLTDARVGILVNFNVKLLKDGYHRKVR